MLYPLTCMLRPYRLVPNLKQYAVSNNLCAVTQGAANLCKYILRTDPNDFHALLQLGRAKGKTGEHEVRASAASSRQRHVVACIASIRTSEPWPWLGP